MLKAESILFEEIIQRGMKRLGVDQRLRQTRVVPREGFKYSSLLGVEVKLENSVEAEVPLYVAEQLFEDGIADPADKALDSKALTMIAWEERHKTSQISKVPDSFYRQLAMLISSDNVAEKTKRVLEASAIEVMDARLKKILTYSLVPSLPKEVTSNLTPEESYMLELLRLIISSWRKEVLRVGGE
jgi:hypothetical protein